MGRNFSRLFTRPLALAVLCALALTLLLAGGASAAPSSASEGPSSTAVTCLSPSPLTQTVLLGQTAHVTVKVSCYPPTGFSFLYLGAKWDDGTTSQYLLCGEVACFTPPFTVDTTHVYRARGDYHPAFCFVIVPASSTTVPECHSVEIIVV